jgi:hypothetical protein
MAKPDPYTPALIESMLESIAGGKSLIGWIKKNKLNYSTVSKWIAEDRDGLTDKYAKAKQAGIDYLADELIDIADDGSNDWMANNDPDNPGYRANGESAARSRLRLDTRKWIASKLKPKVYGDKLDIDANVKGEVVIKAFAGDEKL